MYHEFVERGEKFLIGRICVACSSLFFQPHGDRFLATHEFSLPAQRVQFGRLYAENLMGCFPNCN
jgi:hypothetical protein